MPGRFARVFSTGRDLDGVRTADHVRGHRADFHRALAVRHGQSMYARTPTWSAARDVNATRPRHAGVIGSGDVSKK